jgi:hypothetical protein
MVFVWSYRRRHEAVIHGTEDPDNKPPTKSVDPSSAASLIELKKLTSRVNNAQEAAVGLQQTDRSLSAFREMPAAA